MTIGDRVKKMLGIEGSTKDTLLPMLAYNTKHLSSEGALYLLGQYYQMFLVYVEGLSPGQAAIVFLFKSLWDAAIDPVIGVISDRTRTKWGRRRIYVLLGAVPFGILYIMLWSSFGISAGGNGNRVMVYYIVVYMLFTTVNSFIYVPHDALMPELAKGYFERTQYVSMGYIFNSITMPASFLFSGTLIGIVNTKEFNPGMRPTFLKMGLVLGIIYIFPLLASALLTKEKSSKDMELPPLNVKFLANEYKMVFKNKTFLQYFTITALVFAGYIFYWNSRQYFIYEIVDAKSYLNMITFVAGIAEMLAFPLNFGLTKKFGKAKMAWFTMPFLVASLGLTFFIGRQQPGAGVPWMVVLLFAQEILHPFGYSGISFAVENIAPDITDVDEMITGRRREGMIMMFKTFSKISFKGLYQFFIGIILEWFGVEAKTEGERNVLFNARAADIFGKKWGGPVAGMRLVHGFLPLVFTGLSLLALRKYTMTREELKLIQGLVKEKHETGGTTRTPEEQARLEEIAGHEWEAMWIGQ